MDVAIIEFALLFFALALSKLMVMVIQGYKHRSEVDDMMTQFNLCWNGREEDELYAWYRVRMQLIQEKASQRKKTYVDQRINQVNKMKILSKTLVTPTGDILEKSRKKDSLY
jgi:hypothetical protein